VYTFKYKVIKLNKNQCRIIKLNKCYTASFIITFLLYYQSMNLGDAIYHTEWFLLSISDKKELMMIMMRSTIPVKFTSSFLITLSLQSFSSVSTILYLCVCVYICIYIYIYIYI